ncbi:MAG: aminopeptidase P family protein [Chloroflexi bacterium]|nr:MAG: aminopeptidase P family protein [Chloroflexota bacterium]
MHYTPRDELDTRIQRFQKRLQDSGVDGALILQRADLFYFSGTTQQAHLYVPAEGTPVLVARKSFERARQESALDEVVPMRSLRNLPDTLADYGYRPRRLGLELDVVPASTYLFYQNRIFPDAEVVDVSTLIREVRAVKSEYELDLIREAGRRMEQVMQQVPDLAEEGISQVAFAGRVEAAARALGHPGEVWIRNWNLGVFYGDMVAGPEGATVSNFDSALGGLGLSPATPVGPTESPLRRGEPIVIDYVFVHNGYIVDQTRTFALGELGASLMKAYDAMLEIQALVVEAAGPGAVCGELYNLAVERAQAMGYGEYFNGHGEGQVSFIGHGIGLELDELPVLAYRASAELVPGMVLAIEPKVVFPGVGAVGIENNWVVTEAGLERLTMADDALHMI